MKLEKGNVIATARVETRSDGSRQIVGHAARFYDPNDAGTQYQLGPNVYERITPKAFDRALKEQDDVRALYNHDPDNLLGRLGAGTLRLNVDAQGLRYEIDPPETQLAKELVTLIERGDLTGSSFAFVVEKARWEEENGKDIRNIEAVRLYDVGPVTFPAYGSASTGLRSLESIRDEYSGWLEEKRMRVAEEQKQLAREAATRQLQRRTLQARAASIM